MKYTLLIYGDQAQTLRSAYEETFDVSIVDPNVSLLAQIRQLHPHLLIMDASLLLMQNDNPYADIIKDKIYHDIPLIAYYDGDDDQLKYKLYEFSVKAICTPSDSPQRCVDIALDLLSRSNPHVGSPRDVFIKSFINYEDARGIIIDALYLANYLIRHFRIEPFGASNIRLAIIMLSVGFKKRKIRKVVQLIETLEVSPEVLAYLKNYHKPSTLEEKIIIAAIWSVVEHNHMIPLLRKAYEKLEPDMIELTQDALEHHKIYIASIHDVYVFIMRFNTLLGELQNRFEKIEIYIENFRDLLIHTLVRYGNFYAQIDRDDETFCIRISLENNHIAFDEATLATLRCYCDSDNIEFKVSSYTLAACIKSETETSPNESERSVKTPLEHFSKEDPISRIVSASQAEPLECKRQIDMGVINCMHYEEHQKVSAKAFLEEFDYDSALIDDLCENENDAKDALYFDEGIDGDILEILIKTLMQYTHILNETIEFRDLAYSIDSLIALLQSLNIETVDTEKQKMLKIYLTGIFENLENWKNHIFIAQDSPDIHYLDASLLSDCALVESLFVALTNDDESELEFF
jgi:hypothetical protein